MLIRRGSSASPDPDPEPEDGAVARRREEGYMDRGRGGGERDLDFAAACAGVGEGGGRGDGGAAAAFLFLFAPELTSRIAPKIVRLFDSAAPPSFSCVLGFTGGGATVLAASAARDRTGDTGDIGEGGRGVASDGDFGPPDAGAVAGNLNVVDI